MSTGRSSGAKPWFRGRSRRSLLLRGVAALAAVVVVGLVSWRFDPGVHLGLALVFVALSQLCQAALDAVRVTDRHLRYEHHGWPRRAPWSQVGGFDITVDDDDLQLLVQRDGRLHAVSTVTRPRTAAGEAQMHELTAWLRAQARAHGAKV